MKKVIIILLIIAVAITSVYLFKRQAKETPIPVVQKTGPKDTTVLPTSHLEPNAFTESTNNGYDPSEPIMPVREEMIKIRDARLPSLPEFTLASADVLQDTLVCAHNEDDEAPGVYLCTDSDYKEMMTTYKDFRKYLLQKDFENAWKMGKKLGPYFSGFGGEKYRIYQGSLITITFGPQAWGDVSFSTYTLLDEKIIKQGFAIHASDYTEWENAIVQKFQMKSFDDLYNGSIKYEGETWNNVMKYADEYWYDRFMKTPIQ